MTNKDNNERAAFEQIRARTEKILEAVGAIRDRADRNLPEVVTISQHSHEILAAIEEIAGRSDEKNTAEEKQDEP